jgi:hypothetical protein
VSFRELLERWRESAAVPRTARAYAVRLPVDDAAQLAALADMFPGRTPEQLISELLSVALKEIAAAMPYVAGRRVISTDEQGDPIYEDVGPTPRFMALARDHRRELEAGSPPQSPSPPPSPSPPQEAPSPQSPSPPPPQPRRPTGKRPQRSRPGARAAAKKAKHAPRPRTRR